MPSNRLQPFGELYGPGLIPGVRLDKLEQTGHQGRCDLCELIVGDKGSLRNYSIGSRSPVKKGGAVSQRLTCSQRGLNGAYRRDCLLTVVLLQNANL